MGNMRSISLLITWLAFTLVGMGSAVSNDSARVKTIASKVHCDCGCGDILAECSHVQCPRRSALKQEIAAAVHNGVNDDQILNELATRYGSTILAVPAFRGLNSLLWIVPVGTFGLAIAIAVVVWVRRGRLAKQ
jgi:cytochrome c-type biogenesis protein CcmH/NrfF